MMENTIYPIGHSNHSAEYFLKLLKQHNILANGQLENHEKTIQRLLDELGMQNNELFRSRDEVIDEAFAKREQEIAHTKIL